MEATIPANEVERLLALKELNVLDTLPEEKFDRITRLASKIVGVPIVLVSLVDESRQWFKSSVGLDVTETPRESAFCAHAILQDGVMVVPDTLKDKRFADNPLVLGEPDIRFYAGAPLIIDHGVRLGTLCAIDIKPRELTTHEEESLRDLAAVVVDELKLRRLLQKEAEHNAELTRQAHELHCANQALQQFAYMASHDLRSPLKTIINMADIALLDPEVEAQTSLEYIRKSAVGLEQMVVGYYHLSRLECVRKEDRWLSQLVAEAIQQAGTSLTVEVTHDVLMECEVTLMVQAIANLIDNASHYASTPKITFEATHQNDELVVCARNKVSTALKVDSSVFTPFRRLTREGTGTGLGLAIVERVTQLHGGSVKAHCEDGMFHIEMKFPR